MVIRRTRAETTSVSITHDPTVLDGAFVKVEDSKYDIPRGLDKTARWLEQ